MAGLASPAPAHASDDRYVIDRFDGLDIVGSHPEEMELSIVDSRLAVSVACADPKEVFVRIPFGRQVEDQKMRITIAESSNISYIGKLERLADGRPIPGTFEHAYVDYQKGPVSFSLDNKRHEHLALHFFCTSRNPDITGRIVIDKIEIVPLAFSDDRDFAYVLALVLLIVLLVPGFLVCTACLEDAAKIPLLALLTPLSLLCFAALYAVLLVHQAWSSREAGHALLAAYVTLNLLLLALIARRGRLNRLTENFRRVGLELLAVCIVVLGIAALITEDLDLPLQTFNHLHLRNLTYDVFYAHDSIFQYVNGIAIYHDEPFSRYYANGKLVYEVQDRGIVAGVIYAVLRGIASPLGTDIAYSSGFYTLFGSILNALVLLPVLAVHAYFYPGRARPLLVLLLTSASAFMVTNYIITWYKLAASGLVISGIVVLLDGGARLRHWPIAGLLWGLATNFHPGLALTYPLTTLWLLFRFLRLRNNKTAPVLIAFTALTGSFLTMNLPWSIVKATHYEDTNALFRQHFLGFERYDPNEGIVGSVENFLDRYTLERQLAMRLERLSGSLRIDELSSLISPAQNKDWDGLMFRWNALETSYMAFVLAPLTVLLLVSSVVSRLSPAAAWQSRVIRHRADFGWLLFTQLLTVAAVIFASFGPFEPDINWHIPMSCLVLLVYLLVHATAATGRAGALLLVGYALFSYYRLFYQYF